MLFKQPIVERREEEPLELKSKNGSEMKKQSDGVDVVDESGAGGGLRFGIVATVGVCYAAFTLGIVAYIYRDHVRCFLMRRTRGMYPIPDTPLGFFRAPDPVDV